MNLDRNHGKSKGKDSYFKIPSNQAPSSLFKVQWQTMTSFQKHTHLTSTSSHYASSHNKMTPEKGITEQDILKSHFRFLHDSEPTTWEEKLAFKYFKKLYKEYAMCDLSRYKLGKVALRWRSQVEVVKGTGQFTCSELRCKIKEKNSLSSWEVPFGYVEDNQHKHVLVKVVLCVSCSEKLNYRKKRDAEKESKQKRRKYNEIEFNRQDQNESFEEPEALVEKNELELKHAAAEAHQVEIDKEISLAREEAAEIWSKPIELPKEESLEKEQDFDSYLNDLFK